MRRPPVEFSKFLFFIWFDNESKIMSDRTTDLERISEDQAEKADQYMRHQKRRPGKPARTETPGRPNEPGKPEDLPGRPE